MKKLIDCSFIKEKMIIESFKNVHERMLTEFPNYCIEYRKKGQTFKYSDFARYEVVGVVGFDVNLIFEIVTIYLV